MTTNEIENKKMDDDLKKLFDDLRLFEKRSNLAKNIEKAKEELRLIDIELYKIAGIPYDNN
jgi:hypothetical protein